MAVQHKSGDTITVNIYKSDKCLIGSGYDTYCKEDKVRDSCYHNCYLYNSTYYTNNIKKVTYVSYQLTNYQSWIIKDTTGYLSDSMEYTANCICTFTLKTSTENYIQTWLFNVMIWKRTG